MKEFSENDTRLIFRPTKQQYNRVINLFSKNGRYKHLSEFLRHIVEIGMDELEKKHN